MDGIKQLCILTHKKKRILLVINVFIATLFLWSCSQDPATYVSHRDQESVQYIIDYIVDGVNNNDDPPKIKSMISPNATTELTEDIMDVTSSSTWSSIKILSIRQSTDKYIQIDPTKIRVEGRQQATGLGWNVSGVSIFYEFELVNGEWLLLDTNFLEKTGALYVIKSVALVFLIIFIIMIPFIIFWIKMIIDASKREFKDKTVWIILIVALGLVGAIVYYFAIKRNNNTANNQTI